ADPAGPADGARARHAALDDADPLDVGPAQPQPEPVRVGQLDPDGGEAHDGAADQAAVLDHEHTRENPGGGEPGQDPARSAAGEDAAEAGGHGEEQRERGREGSGERAEGGLPDAELFHGKQKTDAVDTDIRSPAGVPGLEPRLTEPESVVLPITPYPTACGSSRSEERRVGKDST